MDTERIHTVNNFVCRISVVISILLASACSTTGESGTRSATAILDDDKIEYRAERDIKQSDPRFATSHLVIVSHNAVVLLAGEVESDDLKQRAGEIVEHMELVRSVHNELEVGPVTSFSRRTDDTWITTKVKTKLIAHGNIDAGLINITTENGVVFLMGKVPTAQADAAVEVAQTVSGVQKIVKVFELTD
jgi:osmotically-inducible protein OsmY